MRKGGLSLIFGLRADRAWGALVCFVVFAGVATVKALAGAESCGCFGAIAVNPWYTAGFDWIAVAGLLGVRWLGGMGVWVSVAGW